MRIETKKVISAAHIVDGNTKCANLHGHNWTITIGIDDYGTDHMPEDGFMMDFNVIKSYIDKLDHKFIVSEAQIRKIKHPDEDKNNYYYQIVAGGRQYIVPMDVCVVLKIPFTTSEYLCKYFVKTIKKELDKRIDTANSNYWSVSARIEETENNVAEESS